MRFTAPFIGLEVNKQLTNPAGGIHRFQLNTIDSGGDPIAFLNYVEDDGRPIWMGNNAGLVFASPAQLQARLGPNYSSWINVHGNSFVNESSREVKREIEDIRAVLDPLEAIRNARARKFIQETSPTDEPRLGVIAEELPEIIVNRDAGRPGVDLVQQVAVLWGAFNQLLDQETRIVTGRALVPNGTYHAGDTVDVPIVWDTPSPEVTPDVTAIPLASMPTAMGKIRALVVPGSVTLHGCTVRLTFSGVGVTAVTNALPIAVEATGRYIWTPPYTPPEDA
jgi:hypothetical protein